MGEGDLDHGYPYEWEQVISLNYKTYIITCSLYGWYWIYKDFKKKPILTLSAYEAMYLQLRLFVTGFGLETYWRSNI